MGMQGDWLWHDPYMVATPPPILMYTVYLVGGHIGRLLHLSVPWSMFLVYLGCGLVLFASVWRIAASWFAGPDRVWFLAFALGMSGLYCLDAVLTAFNVAPVSLGIMGSPQLSGFARAMLGGHDTLGVAGHIMAITGLLEALCLSGTRKRWRSVAYGAAGCLITSLSEPTQLPLTLGVLTAFAAWWAWWSPSSGRIEQLITGAVQVGLIFLPALPFVIYYRLLFTTGVWSTGGFQSIPAPPGIEPLFSWVLLLPLALWGLYHTPPARRPLAILLALWCVLGIAGRQLPFWQSIRLTDGINIATGMLFALGVMTPRFSGLWRRRALLLTSSGTIIYYIFLLLVLVPGNAIYFYDTSDHNRALEWLAQHSTSRDVVLAPYSFSNVLPAVAPDRLVFGHPWQTLDFATRDREVREFYASTGSAGERAHVLLETRATLVVYDSQDREDGTFNPCPMRQLRVVFSNSRITILRVRST
jgi:hypothetical protein